MSQLVLFHHDPRHSDAVLEALQARACELWGDVPTPPVLAYEGMRLNVGLPGNAAVRSAATANHRRREEAELSSP